MTAKDNFGWDLPPGVTPDDIERAARNRCDDDPDEWERCPACGEVGHMKPNGRMSCCGATAKDINGER